MFVVFLVLVLSFLCVFSYWLNLVLGSVDSNRSVSQHMSNTIPSSTRVTSQYFMVDNAKKMLKGSKKRKLDSYKKIILTIGPRIDSRPTRELYLTLDRG